jgi:succinyl-CoA synthetase beta subunit
LCPSVVAKCARLGYNLAQPHLPVFDDDEQHRETLVKRHEYQSKSLFATHGITVPEGDVATTPAEARHVAQRLGGPVIIKAQVLVGGRGKAGGILLAGDADEAEQIAERILSTSIKDLAVNKVLIERAMRIEREIYLSILLDRSQRAPILIASAQGGMEIEETAKTAPEQITRLKINPIWGLLDFQARDIAFELGLQRELVRKFTALAQALYRLFVASDANLVEINPLVVTHDAELVAVDGKIMLDDNALYRHKELGELRDIQGRTKLERQAYNAGLAYVQLDGDIGCMVNGAGLAMATMDIINLYGGKPANFLDVGGGAKADKVATALRIIMSDPNVKAVLCNIFGGITRCDEVARGLIDALGESPPVPVVARLVGTNEEEGRHILASASLETATTLAAAAEKVIQAAGRSQPG